MTSSITPTSTSPPLLPDLSKLLLSPGSGGASRPIYIIRKGDEKAGLAQLPPEARAWLSTTDFKATPGRVALLPGAQGELAGAVLGLGTPEEAPRNALAPGALPASLPPGQYHFATQPGDPTLACAAWLLGCYRYARYKPSAKPEPRVLVAPAGAIHAEAIRAAEAVWLGRDLINTPASDLGPSDLAAAAVALAAAHGATSHVISGDDLLAQNYPMIHAVGRASTRPPCLVDISWSKPGGKKTAPRIALIGKGICFDTGGLDIKPASAMLTMKKDMGGAAAALALGHMIMGAGLDVQLRILIPAAENSISGNAFRPGDILASRAGISVEIGNTDAEGRLVLADAMTLADQDKPDMMFTFATLTGAARVALGPDLPALFSTDPLLAETIVQTGVPLGDPAWRMPFWASYERMLDSDIADINHVSDGPFAGAVTAALFLKRFVKHAKAYTHLDMYAWTASSRPGQPKGGEVQMARALFEVIRKRAAAGA
jgi:leucyl aminopeptidase